MNESAIKPTRAEDYPEWYQQVIAAAELAENSPTRGCMVIKPWGYAIWENIQFELDKRLKATGHVNAYFPLLIPLGQLEKEAKHIEGFAKECAVVTHHRLVSNGKGGLKPDGELEEPFVIRPTSETMIGAMYAKWIGSHRDLPVLINQWANVMRWEMRTRLFLRTSEFLWQEGHTAHATSQEAVKETLDILDLYAEFSENILAMPVIKGEKTESERFPGAISTYCIEAMMQDGKALQAGTSHFLGQTFAKAYDIKFSDQAGEIKHVWTTSWGVSTRLIGGLIMTHSDDDGLVLPPRVAPQHVVILPIYKNDADRQTVLAYCERLKKTLNKKEFDGQSIRVQIDDRDMRGGEKSWQWIKKCVPVRLEIGPRYVASDSVVVCRRDHSPKEKTTLLCNAFIETITTILQDMQARLFDKAKKYRDSNIREVKTLREFQQCFNTDEKINSGFVTCYAANHVSVDEYVNPLKVSARCIPLHQENNSGKCIFTGRESCKKIIFAKAY